MVIWRRVSICTTRRTWRYIKQNIKQLKHSKQQLSPVANKPIKYLLTIRKKHLIDLNCLKRYASLKGLHKYALVRKLKTFSLSFVNERVKPDESSIVLHFKNPSKGLSILLKFSKVSQSRTNINNTLRKCWFFSFLFALDPGIGKRVNLSANSANTATSIWTGLSDSLNVCAILWDVSA